MTVEWELLTRWHSELPVFWASEPISNLSDSNSLVSGAETGRAGLIPGASSLIFFGQLVSVFPALFVSLLPKGRENADV